LKFLPMVMVFVMNMDFFYQQLIDGYQVESPDNWLRYGTPWEYDRKMPVFPVHFLWALKWVS